MFVCHQIRFNNKNFSFVKKIKIFLDEYEMMDKHEKTQFINEYYEDKNLKSICNAVVPINTPGY